MRRTEVNVFLVAMAILPFLQTMLLNIGTGHYIHVCMYTVYIIFRQNFSRKNKKLTFAIFEKSFSRDCSLHTQRLTPRKPLSWTFCSTLNILFLLTIQLLIYILRSFPLCKAPDWFPPFNKKWKNAVSKGLIQQLLRVYIWPAIFYGELGSPMDA